ncbi:hypothetical protein BDP81DRAFT_433714 [Colletotrichum phormii]|uniref:DUF3669 domain-containing protein n=1 Tax=Colletotrichum phormii TaxID=359342 RepID=A0AAI9ZLD9_9PEZI|nr:uncharacterized protein BDP81DRAFT_433714 [Colletotrichum phormii]KAK1634122.1 hypothetical protein BDP81DRAFT_433714 [Colletotrichum phormii]
MNEQTPKTFKLTTAHSTLPLEAIGNGFCGSVWSAPTSTLAIKREDGGPGRSITNEYTMHRHIIQSLDMDNTSRLRLNVPHCEGFLNHNATAWDQMLPRFPTGYTGCNPLISEKIPPLSRDVRKLLAQKFHPDMDPDEIADSSTNSHCLVRPCLGRRKLRSTDKNQDRPRMRFFSLRNFPLHVNQMETPKMELHGYAVAMAEALAFLHWSAKVDANDVEFVLAAPRRPQTFLGEEPFKSNLGPADFHSDTFGSHAIWILDFDCCRMMTMDTNGIKQACRSFGPHSEFSFSSLVTQFWRVKGKICGDCRYS